MVLSLPPGWIFFLLNSSLNYGTREHFCRCATQTGRDVVFPGHYPPGSSGTPGTTVGTLHCKEKDPLMEEEKTLKRESDRNWSNIKTETLVWHVSASYDVNLCTNIFWLVALALGGGFDPLTRSVRNKTCQLIAMECLPFHSTETGGSKSNWDCYACFFTSWH